MITRQEFPYLQELVINDAYAVKNLRVPVFEPGQDFKHLVLTGRNGSGKTTVLRALSKVIKNATEIDDEALRGNDLEGAIVNVLAKALENDSRERKNQTSVQVHFSRFDNTPYSGLLRFKNNAVIAFFEASRKAEVRRVSSVTQENILASQIEKATPEQPAVLLFKQYLVNKKVAQVFDAMDGKTEGAKQQELFFTRLRETLAKIFEDPKTELEFVREEFEFYIKLSDGRRVTFNQLSAGFSAFLSILTELLMRVDLLRKQINNYDYDPCGFVLIDEPETHLHLEMQYQILALLNGIFPNFQLIVATHSPAVASSIENATIFDLSTGQVLGDTAAGSSFSELMQTHFGLENEYSNVADKILEEVNEIGAMSDRKEALARMQRLLDEQGRYMSPVLRLDVQAHLIHLQREQAA